MCCMLSRFFGQYLTQHASLPSSYHSCCCFTASTRTVRKVTLQKATQHSTIAAPLRSRVICTGSTFSKQSCLFHSVCLQPSPDRQHLTAWLLGAASNKHSTKQNVALLQQHLQHVLQGEYSTVDSRSTAAELTIDLPAASLHNSSPAGSPGNRGSASLAINSRTRSITLAGISASTDSSKDVAAEAPAGAFNASAFETEPAVTVLWRTVRENQYSFGHGRFAQDLCADRWQHSNLLLPHSMPVALSHST
jgi:hypothetical protein